MGKYTICYDNQADAAVLTGGNWQATYPRDALKDYRLKKTARSTNALAASTVVRFALPAEVYVEALSLPGTNASPDATYRYRLFSDATFTTISYDSGVVTLFPAGSMPNSQIPAGAPNAGTGKPLRAQVQRFQCNMTHLLTAPLHARWGELQVNDAANPDGYFEAGRLFIGRVFQPDYPPAYGTLERRLTSRSEVVKARDGTPYFNKQRPEFCLPVAFRHLSQDESLQALELQAIVDVVGDAIAIEDPTDATYWWMRQVFGQLKALDPIAFPRFAEYETSFQVEGTL